jgi:hypothetical protein
MFFIQWKNMKNDGRVFEENKAALKRETTADVDKTKGFCPS